MAKKEKRKNLKQNHTGRRQETDSDNLSLFLDVCPFGTSNLLHVPSELYYTI
jgi:hypothetical protein